MHSERLDQQLIEIERELIRSDPELARRFGQLDDRATRRDRLVFSLLTVSVVLLAVGVSMPSVSAGSAGALAFVASFSVDNWYERRLTVSARASGARGRATPDRRRR